MRTRRPWATYSLTAGIAFWTVMAFGGSVGLASSPDGSAMTFDTAWLRGTPFSDYLLPGLLLGLLGVAGAMLTALLVRGLRARGRLVRGLRARGRRGKNRGGASAWQWYFAVAVTLAHLGWMAGEIALMWTPVAGLAVEQKTFFYGFWWGFGLLSVANLVLAFAPTTRRVLGGPAG